MSFRVMKPSPKKIKHSISGAQPAKERVMYAFQSGQVDRHFGNATVLPNAKIFLGCSQFVTSQIQVVELLKLE